MKRALSLLVALALVVALALWLRSSAREAPAPQPAAAPTPDDPQAVEAPLATPTDVPLPAATPTETPEPTAFDAVIDALQPLHVRLQPGRSVVTKRVRAKVRHASPAATEAQPIRVRARSVDCPPGTIVGVPDFGTLGPERRDAEPVDTFAIPAGRARSAHLTLEIDGSRFTSVQRRAPTRCTIELTAEATAPNNTDPTPGNNVALLELDVVDLGDAERRDLPEILLESIRSTHPGRVEIPPGQTSQTRQVRVMAANVGPVDASVRLRVDRGTCPAGLLGAAEFDRRRTDTRDTIILRAGHKARATIQVNARSGAFAGTTPRSPGRCVANLSLESDDGDTDPSNNRTHLVVDVYDRNQ